MKRTPLKRTGGPQRATKPKPDLRDPKRVQARVRWAYGAQNHPCARCRGRAAQHGHHVIYKQEIRRAVLELQAIKTQFHGHLIHVEDVIWDERNRLWLCEACHARHHSGFDKLPLSIVRRNLPNIDEFATLLDRSWWLERYYD